VLDDSGHSIRHCWKFIFVYSALGFSFFFLEIKVDSTHCYELIEIGKQCSCSQVAQELIKDTALFFFFFFKFKESGCSCVLESKLWLGCQQIDSALFLIYNTMVLLVYKQDQETQRVCVCFFVDRIEAVSVMGRLSFEIPGLLPPAPFFFRSRDVG